MRAANPAVVIQGLCLNPDDYSSSLLTGGLTVIIAGEFDSRKCSQCSDNSKTTWYQFGRWGGGISGKKIERE